jgi:hypothetical protein
MNEMQRMNKPMVLTESVLQIAKIQNEDCHHLDLMNITVCLKNMDLNDHSKVKVKIKCLKCNNKFEKTQRVIQRTFFTEF